MIVTCPGCAAKYRVRNEAVPSAGARMRCPKCETLFLAKPPAGDDASTETAAPGAPAPAGGRTPVAASRPTGQFPAVSLAPVGPGLAGGRSPSRPPMASVDFNPFGTGTGSSISGVTSSSQITNLGSEDAAGPFTGGSSIARTSFDPFTAPTADIHQQRPGAPGPALGAQDMFSDMLGAGGGRPPAPTPSSYGSDGLALSSAADAPMRDRGPPREPQALARPAPHPAAAPSQARAPSRWLEQIGTWALLAVSALVAVGGLGFAGWTSEAVDLDPWLMPTFEERFGVSPPRSFLQRDEPTIEKLLEEVGQAQVRGDLAGETLVWKQILARDANHRSGRDGLKLVLAKLGEPLPPEYK